MKRILVFSLATALLLGLTGVVYASPLNQQISYEIEEFIDDKFDKDEMDPCLLEGHENHLPGAK